MRSRLRASSNAKRTQRSTPMRVFDRALRRDLVRRAVAQEAAFARVRAFGVLADDEEVDAVVVAVRPGLERAQVHVEVEREAHLQQQAALEHAGRHVGRADRAEQDRVVARAARRARSRAAPRRSRGSGGRRGRSRRCRARRRPRARPSSASAVTSGPMPSPPMIPTRWATAPFLSPPLGTKKPPTLAWTVESERRSGVRLRNDDYARERQRELQRCIQIQDRRNDTLSISLPGPDVSRAQSAVPCPA